MPTPNDRDFNRETTRREVYRDPQGNVHVNQSTPSTDPVYPPIHSDPVPLSERAVPPVDPRDPRPLPDRTAYRAGYANGQLVENRLHQEEEDRRLSAENQIVRDNDNAARGLLLGILLTSLVGLAIGAFALLNRQQPAPVAPVIVPNSSTAPAPFPATSSPAPAAPNRETTVIERTTQVVPVPQQRTIERVVVPAPSPQAPSPAASPASPLPQGTIVVPSPTTPATQPPTAAPGGTGTGATPTNGTAGQ